MKLRSLTQDKKGMLGGLAGNIIAIVVAVIVLVLGLVIVQEMRDTQTEDTAAYNAADDSLSGLATFADFIPLIVLAVAASIIIGLVLVGFAFGGRRR